jgi:hypothetical protein
MVARNGTKFESVSFRGRGYAGGMHGDSDVGDLLRLAAATEIVLALAERVDGDVADEAILAELQELLDRTTRALQRATAS